MDCRLEGSATCGRACLLVRGKCGANGFPVETVPMVNGPLGKSEFDYRRERGTFMDRMLAPWVTRPLPPTMTRRTGRPVLGSVFSGASLIFCSTSKRRGFSFG